MPDFLSLPCCSSLPFRVVFVYSPCRQLLVVSCRFCPVLFLVAIWQVLHVGGDGARLAMLTVVVVVLVIGVWWVERDDAW
jgi:hypothetical protein